MKSKNLIFDIDGTLWNATQGIAQAYNEVLRKENEAYPTISIDMMEHVMGWMIEDIAEHFFPYLDYKARMALIKKCCDHENEYLSKHGGVLYPDLIDVLTYLYNKGYHLFIVSNCQDGYVDALCNAHPIKTYFTDSECSGRTGLTKGENIAMLMKRNHLNDAIYIGDTQKDKEACVQAGIPFIYAAYGFGEVDGYDAAIERLKDLKELF